MIKQLASFSPIISKYITYFSREGLVHSRNKIASNSVQRWLDFLFAYSKYNASFDAQCAPTCSLVHGSMIHVDFSCSHRS